MDQLGSWEADWLVGAVMTVGTVVLHILGLGLIHLVFLRLLSALRGGRQPEAVRSLMLMTPVVFLIFLLHAVESTSWAAAYVLFLAVLLFRPQGLFGRAQT
jgi:branched-subunit amino acid ABC-type transport system permease component